MSNNKVFWTGLITVGKEPTQPKPPFVGAGWTATLAPQREGRFTVRNGEEIVVSAKSWETAQRALDLILGCHQLFLGDPPITSAHPIAHNDREPEWMDQDLKSVQVGMARCALGFPLACAIAAKATRNRRWVHAVAKYTFSQSIYSVHSMDLEPGFSRHLSISAFPYDHVMFSYAIVSAYSAIEDLGLELRARESKPSRIKGNWNPIVKQELEERLSKAGVDLGEALLWTLRGPKRMIERRRPIPLATKAPWSRWFIRDCEITVADALAYADWLRDRVASHATKKLTRALSPYDVVNVQHLARRLLLESLGFWRWHDRQRGMRKGQDCQ